MKVIEYFKEDDHRKALYASLIFIMLMILFFLLVSLEEPDPPIEPDVIVMDLPDIEIEQGSEAAGGNDNNVSETAEPTPNNEVQESTQEVVQQTEESTYVPSGNGNTETDNTAESEPQVDDAFTFGGGDGEGDGNGTTFGDGNGVGGDGEGNTPGGGTYNPSRKVTTNPTFNANAQEEGVVAIDIWVDANGNVVQTRFNQTQSNTGNQYLIKLAEKAAKTMKYNKKPGAATEKVGYKKFKFIKS